MTLVSIIVFFFLFVSLALSVVLVLIFLRFLVLMLFLLVLICKEMENELLKKKIQTNRDNFFLAYKFENSKGSFVLSVQYNDNGFGPISKDFLVDSLLGQTIKSLSLERMTPEYRHYIDLCVGSLYSFI